jgi:hypothetical protein
MATAPWSVSASCEQAECSQRDHSGAECALQWRVFASDRSLMADRSNKMPIWPFAIIMAVLVGLSLYFFGVSRNAQKAVDAAYGPPLFQEKVDFSKPFTNEFNYKHTVQPFYGMMYLMVSAEPWPTNWSDEQSAGESLRRAKGEMLVYEGTNKVPIGRSEINWFYPRLPSIERKDSALEKYYGSLPLGDYRLVIKTKEGVPELSGRKQELALRYDLIHEVSLADAFRKIGIFFLIVNALVGGFFVCLIVRGARTAS